MEVYLGTILLFAFNFPPRGFAICNGALLSIAQNTALFSLIGTTYGGNGQTNFALPNLMGRVPLGQGQGGGLSNYVIGQAAGAESVTLLLANLPSHNHTVNVVDAAAATTFPTGALLAQSGVRGGAGAPIYTTSAPNAQMAPNMINPAGGGQPASILQPYLCINYCIATTGIFPTRQ